MHDYHIHLSTPHPRRLACTRSLMMQLPEAAAPNGRLCTPADVAPLTDNHIPITLLPAYEVRRPSQARTAHNYPSVCFPLLRISLNAARLLSQPLQYKQSTSSFPCCRLRGLL